MQDCLFCKIAAGEITTDAVYRDEYVLAFRDINPQAPIHLVIIPIKHIESVTADDVEIMGNLMLAVKKIAEGLHLNDGFRLVINSGKDAGQEIEHLHVHILGGRTLGWPPG